MKKALMIAGVAALILGCRGNNNRTTTTTTTTTTVEHMDIVADAHNAQNSLDYEGTYKGTIPCADCEGIEVTLTLHRDGGYKLKQKYLTEKLGKDVKTEFEAEGRYTWNDQGTMITLEGLENQPAKYLVQENRLVQLDLSGNRITGNLAEYYVLTK